VCLYKLSDQQFLVSDFQLFSQLLASIVETLATSVLLYNNSELVLIKIKAEAKMQLE
jgi:hypothetical protein